MRRYLGLVLLMFRTYLPLYSCSYSSLVIRLAARVKSPPSAIGTLCTNTSCAYNTRFAASVATMSTVAIPQQPLSQPLHHHAQLPSSYDPHGPTLDSEPPISPSITSSKTSRRSKKSSQDRKVEEVQPDRAPRMSAFFPLGYKEAASQWVS